MSAERLKEAARVLREDAEVARRDADGPWKWRVTGDGKWAVVIDSEGCWMAQVDDGDRAAYIATMHPGVGLALADWLDAQYRHVTRHECEAQCEYPYGCDQTRIAYRIADLILGGAP